MYNVFFIIRILMVVGAIAFALLFFDSIAGHGSMLLNSGYLTGIVLCYATNLFLRDKSRQINKK